MAEQFDRVSKSLAEGMPRRQAVKLLLAGIAGTAFALLTGRAEADPQICVTCYCGNGKPCNVKSSTCTTMRGFPSAQAACSSACSKQGQHVCSTGTAFHCPQGCP